MGSVQVSQEPTFITTTVTHVHTEHGSSAARASGQQARFARQTAGKSALCLGTEYILYVI